MKTERFTGLNVSTGIFTAPYAGTYAFHFHALTRDGTATYIKVQLNGRNVGGAYRRHEGEEVPKDVRYCVLHSRI